MQLTGIMIKTDETNITPNIYLEKFYEQYQDRKDFDDILRDIAEVRIKRDVGKDFDVNMITDLDQVREHIICKLVNAEMNAEYLANKPHTRIEMEKNKVVCIHSDMNNQCIGSRCPEELRTYQAKFFTCHCTGIPAFAEMKRIMGDQLGYVHSGEEIVF